MPCLQILTKGQQELLGLRLSLSLKLCTGHPHNSSGLIQEGTGNDAEVDTHSARS